MTGPLGRRAWLHAAVGGAVTAIVLSLGGSPFEGAPPTTPARLAEWVSTTDPVAAAFSLLRVAVLAGAAYWTGLGLVALGVGWRARRPAVVERLSKRLPGFGVVARGFAGGSIAGSALLGCATQSSASSGPSTPPTSSTASPAPTTVRAAVPSTGPQPPRLIPLGPVPGKGRPARHTQSTSASNSTTTSPPAAAPATTIAPAPRSTTLPGPVTVPATRSGFLPPTQQGGAAPSEGKWTVRPGDNLWSIAESVVARRLGRPPSDAETGGYWLRLIALNRSRLPDPGNPGLIFAGDSIVLPAL